MVQATSPPALLPRSLFSLLALALALTLAASASPSAPSWHDLRRASSENQATITHDPLTDVWDAETGRLKEHARGIVASRWKSGEHSETRRKREAAEKSRRDVQRRRRDRDGGSKQCSSTKAHSSSKTHTSSSRSKSHDYEEEEKTATNWSDDDGWGIAVAHTENLSQDNEWLVEVGYGTPAQNLRIVLDSGSAGAWAYSPACCYSSNHSSFNPHKSSTFSNRTLNSKGVEVRAAPGVEGTPWNQTYGTSQGIFGYLGIDTMRFASGALKLENMTTALVTNTTGTSRASRKMEGLIGLIPTRALATTTPGGWRAPFQVAIEEGKLEKPYLSATFVKADRRTGTGGGGRYTFGSIDHAAVKGDIVWNTVTSSTYWGLTLGDLYLDDGSTRVNMTDPSDTTHRAIVDTGSALLLLTTAAADKVNNAIHGSLKRNDSSLASPWLVPCRTGLPEYEASLPRSKRAKPFYLELGGVPFGVPVNDFVFWPLEPIPASEETDYRSDLCLSAFQPTTSAFSIIGDVFIKNHALIFDMGSAATNFTDRRVGVANRTDVTGL